MKHLSEIPKAPSELRPEIPTDLDMIVLRALAKDPADRFESAEEMERELARVAGGGGVTAETAEAATAVLAGAGLAEAAPTMISRRPVVAPRETYDDPYYDYEEPPRRARRKRRGFLLLGPDPGRAQRDEARGGAARRGDAEAAGREGDPGRRSQAAGKQPLAPHRPRRRALRPRPRRGRADPEGKRRADLRVDWKAARERAGRLRRPRGRRDRHDPSRGPDPQPGRDLLRRPAGLGHRPGPEGRHERRSGQHGSHQHLQRPADDRA